MRQLVILWACLVFGCGGGESWESREQYNDGLAAMEAGELDRAAEALLAARDQAGGDGELRFRAAYNLGLVHARRAEAAEGDEAALEALRTSAAWFRDAVRLRPEDDEARANLEIVLRRVQVVADRLNQGKNGLEARLTRLIADQRDLRDAIRQLWTAVDEAGAQASPTDFSDQFAALATRERALYAEVGVAADLAADELALLEGKPAEELTDADKVRQVQLQALGAYLQEARFGIDEGRRALRKLSAEASHERATAALAALVRAREQLLDPVAVLRAVAQDEMLLWQHTSALETLGKDTLSLDGDAPDEAAAPSWLSGAHLAARQRDLRERAAEVAARFRAAAEAKNAGAAQADADPRAARAIEAAAEALPALDRGVAAMDAAATALDAELVASAGERETEALRELAAAIERFAGLRALIELAHGEQRGVVTLLDPAAAADAEMSTAERAEALSEAVARNVDRLERLEGLLADERAAAEAELAQAGGQGGAAAQPDPEAAQAVAARFDAAEEHRAAALEAVRALAEVAARVQGGGGGDEALALARTGLAEIEELRRLFFSIVEHLKDLLRRQGQTHDRSAEAQGLVGDDMLALLGPAADAQAEHAAMADALAAALAEQADAAAQAGQQQQGQGPTPDALARAASEVRAAAAAMHGAAATLSTARDDAARMSVDLSPALEDQPEAMAHLEEAIRLLQPPQQQNQQQQDQQQQKQQQQDQQQKQLSREQAQRRLQAIREREAQRRRERDKPPAPQPVEKDW